MAKDVTEATGAQRAIIFNNSNNADKKKNEVCVKMTHVTLCDCIIYE